MRKTGIALENLRLGDARREIVEHNGDRYPSGRDTSLSMTNVWVDGDAPMPLHIHSLREFYANISASVGVDHKAPRYHSHSASSKDVLVG